MRAEGRRTRRRMADSGRFEERGNCSFQPLLKEITGHLKGGALWLMPFPISTL
jgi:hypothetical protein